MNPIVTVKNVSFWEGSEENILHVDINYPRSQISKLHTIEVGLTDVRAADSIRISYDFERDGWSIKQASIFQWEADDKEHNADWQEVAFVQAWARQKDEEESCQSSQQE